MTELDQKCSRIKLDILTLKELIRGVEHRKRQAESEWYRWSGEMSALDNELRIFEVYLQAELNAAARSVHATENAVNCPAVEGDGE